MTEASTACFSGTKSTPASFTLQREEGRLSLRLAGDWTVLTVGAVEASFVREVKKELSSLSLVDFSDVSRMDATGSLILQRVIGESKAEWKVPDEHFRRMLKLTSEAPRAVPDKETGSSTFIRFLNEGGKAVVDEFRLAIQAIGFMGEYLVTLGRVLIRPRSLPLTPLIFHMYQVGVAAVPIVALLSFLIGLVIAYMGAMQLSMFGAEIFVVDLVSISVLRELGVLMTSIVVAGRSGSSFTAQIGAMVSNEEVAAMQTMGLSPMLRLVFPRITALLFMLPALVFLANIMGMFGGGVAVWSFMDMAPGAYVSRFHQIVNLKHFYIGMVKAPFFAVVIGIIGCFQGFQVTGSAESVGRLTTQSVVESIFMVILLDAFFAIFFMGLGI